MGTAGCIFTAVVEALWVGWLPAAVAGVCGRRTALLLGGCQLLLQVLDLRAAGNKADRRKEHQGSASGGRNSCDSIMRMPCAEASQTVPALGIPAALPSEACPTDMYVCQCSKH